MRVGYAAFLDVLGFSALISGDQGSRVEKYLECLREVFDQEPPGTVDYVVFSDSIILTTPDDSLPSLQALLARCSSFLWVMLRNDIALRGAIAHGPYVAEKTGRGTFVAGKAIIDAYHFEGAQDWIGIMLAPSVIQRVPDLQQLCRVGDPFRIDLWEELNARLPWAAFVQPCSEIPFRAPGTDATNFEGFAIVPTHGDRDASALFESLSAATERLVWLKSIAPNPQAQEKYVRTLTWLWEVCSKWQLVTRRRDQNSW
jgi:hypothetical protein